MTNPSYDDVSSGNTGHAEVIKIEFDSSQITYEELLDIFWHTHNPTTLNRQGNDVGTQYRSIIFYMSEEQKRKAEASLQDIQEEIAGTVVTEIKPFEKFYDAESYHRNYFEKNSYQPYCQIVIAPKIQKFLEKYKNKIK
jgi:peptide-methionine (S)-S-oxide reductase